MKAQTDVSERQVTLTGYMPMMLDRYAGDNKTQLAPEQKMYLLPDNQTLCLPAINLSSFLSAINTTSVAKLIGGKQYKDLAAAFLGYVQFIPNLIPVTRNAKPIVFTGFVDDRDEAAGIYIDRRVARLARGVPNPKVRPVIELPWELAFTLRFIKNTMFDEILLRLAFDRGGESLGLGTYRGLFGKFTVTRWE